MKKFYEKIMKITTNDKKDRKDLLWTLNILKAELSLVRKRANAVIHTSPKVALTSILLLQLARNFQMAVFQ